MVLIDLVDANLPEPPKGKYPAKENAKRVWQTIVEQGYDIDSKEGNETIIFLESQKTSMVEDDDQPKHFRQRRSFYYLSGCELPDSYVIYRPKLDQLTLYIPPIDQDIVIWDGLPLTIKDAMVKYDIDSCLTTSDLKSELDLLDKNTFVLLIPELHSIELPKHLSHTKQYDTSKTSSILRSAIDMCRVVKSNYEIELLRHANAITSYAHKNVALSLKQAKNESELMGAFIGTCIANGGREQAYACICATGPNAATLHYVHNDLGISDELNLLIDAGCEYKGYCSDVTRCYPINGEWTEESKNIYNLVDEMQSECMKLLKAGVKWENVHELAHKIAIKGLMKIGLLKGDHKNEEILKEAFDSRVSTLFLPHGLGHYLGMDTHDVGGNANYDDPDPMFKYLRIRGELKLNSVVTNEPGLYFCRFIIEPALKDEKYAKWIDVDVLERYWNVGGIRIEDDIWIKEDGYENLTTAPRSLEEIERLAEKGERLNIQ